MKRNITITIDKSTTNPNHIFVTGISSLINFSCDSIIINCLEYLSDSDHIGVIKTLLEKLRPQGRLIVSFYNARIIAEKLINTSISNSDFLHFFSNKKSLVSLESIYTMIDFTKFDIIETDINDTTIKLILERKPL